MFSHPPTRKSSSKTLATRGMWNASATRSLQFYGLNRNPLKKISFFLNKIAFYFPDDFLLPFCYNMQRKIDNFKGATRCFEGIAKYYKIAFHS